MNGGSGVMIRAENIFKSYPQDDGRLEILRGVSLEVESPASAPGEEPASASAAASESIPPTVALMGRSGCGKSTLISILAGLDTPTTGKVEILGQNLSALSGRELNRFRARHIGIVFQQFHLLDHLTAYENARVPLDLNGVESADEKAKEVLEKVRLSHRMNHFPDQLSRGECQRVAIARVLVMKPEVILADEPTGSLDVRTGREVIDLIFNLVVSEKMALVMATHDPRVAERCQRLLYMDSGLLTTNRPPDFAALWG
jgi:putative ABC transport system ATP-binding protein